MLLVGTALLTPTRIPSGGPKLRLKAWKNNRNRAMNPSHYKMRKMPAMQPWPEGSPFSPQNSHSPKGQVFASAVFVGHMSQMHSFVFQVEGTSVRPRLAVFRSHMHMQLPWHLTTAQCKIRSKESAMSNSFETHEAMRSEKT